MKAEIRKKLNEPWNPERDERKGNNFIFYEWVIES